MHVSARVNRHQRLTRDGSYDVRRGREAVNGGKVRGALRRDFSRHCVRPRRREHPPFHDVSNRENVRRVVQPQVVVDFDKTLRIQRGTNHWVALRVSQSLRVRLGSRAPVHLARGENLAGVRGVLLQHVVKLDDSLIQVNLDAQRREVVEHVLVASRSGKKLRPGVDKNNLLPFAAVRGV